MLMAMRKINPVRHHEVSIAEQDICTVCFATTMRQSANDIEIRVCNERGAMEKTLRCF
jgi:hypothetical protein